jgi:hypothetical protein
MKSNRHAEAYRQSQHKADLGDNGVGLNNTIFTILNVFKTVRGWGKLSLIDTTDLSGLGATEKGAKGDRLLFD